MAGRRRRGRCRAVEVEEGAPVAAARSARPCRPASGRRSRGPGRAARSRPGRRGCGRAARRRRRAGRRPRPGRRSGRRGRRPRARRCRPTVDRERPRPGRGPSSVSCGGDLGGAVGGAGLQPVVDGDGAGAQPGPGASKARAAASAMESAPPLQATSTRSPGARSAPRRGPTGVRQRSPASAPRASTLPLAQPASPCTTPRRVRYSRGDLHACTGRPRRMLYVRRRRAAYVVDAGQAGSSRGVTTRATQAAGSAISALVGRLSAPGPDPVEAVHADLVDDAADEPLAVAVLPQLGVEAEQPRGPPARPGAPPCAGVWNFARISATDGITDGPDAVHHEVGVPLEQGHQGGDAVQDLALRGGLHRLDQRAAARVAESGSKPSRIAPYAAAAAALSRSATAAGSTSVAPTKALDLAHHVLAQPRHRAELHPVGLLVQAHPEPEVARVDVQLALGRDDVRRDQQQPAGLVGRGPRRTAGTARTARAPWSPGTRAASRSGRRSPSSRRRRRPATDRGRLLLDLLDQRLEHGPEARRVGLDPAGPVDDHDRVAAVGRRRPAG